MTTSTSDSKQPRSAYQQKTLNLQHASRKQLGSMLGRGIGLTAGGVIMAMIVLVGVGMLKEQGNIILLGGGAVSLYFFFTGLSMLYRSLFNKHRAVVCPYCGRKYTLFRSVKSFVCDGCGHALRFAGDEKELVRVRCPHCDLEWAASPNSGPTRCFSCGARLSIQSGAVQYTSETEPCPGCGAANPAGSYFCWQCGAAANSPEPVMEPDFSAMSESISVEPNREGMDFITARAVAQTGLLFNAVSRLNAIIPAANALPEENFTGSKEVRQVEYSLEDVEEALTLCPEYAGMVRSMLPGVTRIMARLLKGLKVGTMAYGDTDRYNSHWRDLSALYNRLTSKANPGVNLTLQKIGWPSQLVKVSRGGPVGNANPPQFATIIDNEADLKDWVKRNLPDGPLELLPAPIRKTTR